MVKYTPVSGIYVILNTKNGHIYIGQTQDFRQRWRKHLSMLRRGCHDNRHLQSAWNKYGEQAFKFKKLEYCPVGQLNEREQHYLDVYMAKNMCYNLAIDALSPSRGRKMSDEQRQRLSIINKGRKVSESTRLKQSEAGKNKSPEHIEKLRAASVGRKISEETRQKMRDGVKLRPPISEETRRKMSESKTGKKHPNFGKSLTEETRKKISLKATGKTITDETREKLMQAHLGKTLTEEHRQKMSESHKGKIFSDEHRHNLSEAKKAYHASKKLEASDTD